MYWDIVLEHLRVEGELIKFNNYNRMISVIKHPPQF